VEKRLVLVGALLDRRWKLHPVSWAIEGWGVRASDRGIAIGQHSLQGVWEV
jgi:hypothetical protein